MSMDVTVVDNQIQAVLMGSIYEAEANAIRDALISHIDAERTTFLLDFSDVDIINSEGIGSLVMIQQQAVKKGGSVIITGLTEYLRTRFELNQLDKIFEIR